MTTRGSSTPTPQSERPTEGRLSALSAALLRISASLELETVLNEIVESARVLTGARYAAIVTIDAQGAPCDFLTSGFTEQAHRAMEQWSDGPKLFAFFRDLEGPLRIADVPAHVRALGFSPSRLPWGTFQGTPMRHRGVHVGNFYLVEKEGAAEFTDDDEEVLVVLGGQAAAAIAHARAYRQERRARADLEALVETSPVGVVVFDAATGALVSLNREARRLVEALRLPGHGVEELLGTITCRRADGREIALAELPLAAVLSNAETVRAEEIELCGADGRRITTLVNATPIHADGDDGALASVVVTMQDLAPLEELDRMRADFLAMVSHELRAPLAAIRGSSSSVLGASAPLGQAEMREFFRIIEDQAEHMRSLIADLLDAGRIDAGVLSVAPESSDLSELVEQARTTFLSGDGRHTILIDLPPGLPHVMADRQRIVQVLNNLLSNAARHASPSTPIRVTAERDAAHVAVSVCDDGSGATPERLAGLFGRYQGTGDSRGKGRGLGLAICKGLVEAHGGRIRAESPGPGQGMRVVFTVPVGEVQGDAASQGVASEPSPGRTDAERLRILVVDDDPQMLRYVRDALAEAGYAPLVIGDHEQLARIIEREKPALVLLDLVLPGADGIALVQSIPELAELPVVFISGYGRDETIARALEAGADDYLVKPFSTTELIARVRAALRRRAAPERFVLGELAIDYERRRVTVADRPVELTATEFEVLRVLSLGAGRVVTYDALIRQVWGGHSHGNPKLVRAFVMRLREKLGRAPGRGVYIETVRGVGYCMARLGDTQRSEG